ncbi:MAG: DUF6325 family protein [Methanomicrobiales archaeon]|nr:DUF6325 family protein [Methanomicrobiales archaeon]
MSLGPVEYLVIEFPGNQFKGEIIPALREVVDNGSIRIIDLVFVRKDDQGRVSVMELDDLSKDAADAFAPIAQETRTLLSDEDIQKLTDVVDRNSSAAFLLFEHLWAKRFQDALLNARARVLAGDRIPRERVDAALAWREEQEAAAGSTAS